MRLEEAVGIDLRPAFLLVDPVGVVIRHDDHDQVRALRRQVHVAGFDQALLDVLKAVASVKRALMSSFANSRRARCSPRAPCRSVRRRRLTTRSSSRRAANMSITVMPGFTPANAMTSAGLSRASRSRSASVRSGFATADSMASSAASGGNDGQRQGEQGAEQQCFHGVLLGRALCERRRADAELHPSRRLLILANTSPFPGGSHAHDFHDSSRSTLLLAASRYHFRGGRRLDALRRHAAHADARAAVSGRPGARPVQRRRAHWSKKPMGSRLTRRNRPTNASSRRCVRRPSRHTATR